MQRWVDCELMGLDADLTGSYAHRLVSLLASSSTTGLLCFSQQTRPAFLELD
jgi:hypothetical protein